MNLFEISAISSAIAGTAVGIKNAVTAPWPTIICAVIGLLVGIISYVIAISPGVAALKLSANEDISSSSPFSAAGMLLFTGAFVSPVVAYYLVDPLFDIVIPWLS